MFERDPERSTCDALLNLAEQGVFPLPAAVEHVATIEADLRAKMQAAMTIERGQVGALIESISDELAAGKQPDDIAGAIAEAHSAEQLLDMEQRVWIRAHSKAQTGLIASVKANAAEIHRSLSRVFDDLLGKVRLLEPELRGRDLTNAALFVETKDSARKSYIALTRAADSYDSIIESRGYVRRLTGWPQHDTEGMFSVLQDPRGVYGDRWAGRYQSKSKVWPTERLSYVLWLSTQDSWLPTVAEQDAAYQAMVDESRRGGRQAVGTR